MEKTSKVVEKDYSVHSVARSSCKEECSQPSWSLMLSMQSFLAPETGYHPTILNTLKDELSRFECLIHLVGTSVVDQAATSRTNHPREVLFMTKRTSWNVENCIRRKTKKSFQRLQVQNPSSIQANIFSERQNWILCLSPLCSLSSKCIYVLVNEVEISREMMCISHFHWWFLSRLHWSHVPQESGTVWCSCWKAPRIAMENLCSTGRSKNRSWQIDIAWHWFSNVWAFNLPSLRANHK